VKHGNQSHGYVLRHQRFPQRGGKNRCCQEHDVLLLALDTYAERNLDFVDCVLYSYHAVKNVEIATFDKKLLKLLSE
jgi:hypothetical protein